MMTATRCQMIICQLLVGLILAPREVRGQQEFILTAYSAYVLYADGTQQGPGDNWNVPPASDIFPLQQYTRLIALQAINTIGCSGALGSIALSDTEDLLVTDASWKCSAVAGANWNQLGYDDSAWNAATQVLPNGGTTGQCPGLPPMLEISPQAYWIWTSNFATGDAVVYCRILIPVCDSSPCVNGATCLPNSPLLCNCVPGFTGQTCETNIDECENDPCVNGGTCVDGINEYTCDCRYGFTGDICETDISECAIDPCQNNATCGDEGNGYYCDCIPGYTGTDCETEIDECESEPCQNNATCNDFLNEFACDCVLGFTGDVCETQINYCDSMPCQSESTCIPFINGFQCICTPGHTGTFCEIAIDACASIPCQNGGLCIATDNTTDFICSCHPGYTGFVCDIEIDFCESQPCVNTGTCLSYINGYNCQCNPLFTGVHCEAITPNCGTAMHVSMTTPPQQGWSILCYITTNDTAYTNTPCNQLITGIPFYGDYTSILAGGGNFGCWRSASVIPENGGCSPNYQQAVTLSSCLACQSMSACIRFQTLPSN